MRGPDPAVSSSRTKSRILTETLPLKPGCRPPADQARGQRHASRLGAGVRAPICLPANRRWPGWMPSAPNLHAAVVHAARHHRLAHASAIPAAHGQLPAGTTGHWDQARTLHQTAVEAARLARTRRGGPRSDQPGRRVPPDRQLPGGDGQPGAGAGPVPDPRRPPRRSRRTLHIRLGAGPDRRLPRGGREPAAGTATVQCPR